MCERVYPTSQPNRACFHASRLISASDSVRGISLGQALTQFCAFAQSSIPPCPITAWMRSLACIAPVGCMLNNRTWLKMAAPMKSLCSLTCGQTSRQFPHVMQRDSGYAFSCTSGDTRGPSPRLYVPSIGIHAFTRLRLSNMNCRSTVKSRTRGNFDIGSMRIGCSSLSTSAEQAMRALPLMSIAQEPQISSRQFESYEIGVVFFPSRVTGFSAMSRRQMMTFIEGRHLRENSSQRAASFGPACRFTLTMTCFVSAIIPQPATAQHPKPGQPLLFCRVVTPRPRLNQRNIHGLIRKLNVVVHPLRARGLQPVDIIAVRKIRLVVRPARFVARQRPQRDNSRQNNHVFQLAREVQRLVRPLRAVAEIDLLVALLQRPNLPVRHFQILIDARDGHVLRHHVSQFTPNRNRIFRPALADEFLILFLLPLFFQI